MSNITLLLPSSKWKLPFLEVPNHGRVKRPPNGQTLAVYSLRAATWLLDHGYAYKVPESESTPEEPAGEGAEGEPDSSGVEFRQVVVRGDSTLSLEPPIVTSVPGDGENFLVRFFNRAPAEEIAAVKGLSQSAAEQLVSARKEAPLDWTDVVRLLSDKQLQGALKWASQQVK